jgi:polyhydroxyalkanoate synthesis regulator phasin
VRDALKSYLALASGLTDITRQRAVGAAKALVAQGEATAEQVTALAEDLLQQSRSNRAAVVALVKYEVDRGLGRVGLASGDEVAELSKRVRELEAQLRERGGPARSSAQPVARTSAVKKAAVKKAAAKKAVAKKAVGKKAGPTKPARKSVTKATSRAAKKAAPKKAAPKRAGT